MMMLAQVSARRGTFAKLLTCALLLAATLPPVSAQTTRQQPVRVPQLPRVAPTPTPQQNNTQPAPTPAQVAHNADAAARRRD